MMPTTNTGNKYKSLRLTIVDGTTDYNVAKENSSSFPDWSKDWDKRDWFNVLVIKRMTPENGLLSIKFHRNSFQEIPIAYCDTPTIIDDFVFRDVFISNTSGEDIAFDIIFFSPLVITGEPKRPLGFKVSGFNASSVTLSFKDTNVDESYYIIERSSVSATSGFSVVDQAKFRNFNQMPDQLRTYTDNTVSSGVTYWYRAYAVRKDGLQSNYSDITTVTMP